MKIYKKNLLKTLQKHNKINKKEVMPIMECSKIELTKYSLTITTVRWEGLTLITSLPVTGGYDDCVFCVKTTDFLTAVKNSTEMDVDIERDSQTQTLKIGNITLGTKLASEFPSLPETNDRLVVSYPTKNIIKGINRVKFAVSKDETRYHLNGVYFDASGVIVSTDGVRLAKTNEQFPDFFDGIILPSFCFALLDEGMTGISCQFHKKTDAKTKEVTNGKVKYVRFNSGSERVIVKVIDGDFPNWTRVIPEQDEAHTTSFQVNDCLSIANQIVAASKDKQITITITLNGAMELSNNPLDDSPKVAASVKTGKGLPLVTVNLNARHFKDAIQDCHGAASIQVTDKTRPVVIKTWAKEEFGETLTVIMPMRI